MHASAQRLYEAARLICSVSGQSAVAGLLNESPQTVKNWEARGVSAEGAIKAEQVLGCRAAWVRNGHGEMGGLAPFDSRPDTAPPNLASALESLGLALAADLPDDVRQDAADLLAKLAHRRGAARHQDELLLLLQAKHSKRNGTQG
jgi:hypothetical protein